MMMELKVVLQKIELYSCKICRRGYADYLEYKTHILTHVENAYVKLDKQKIYRCKSCNAGFLKADDFKLHQIHHIKQNVKKKHIQNDSDRKHYINSKIVRNFKCPDCGRKFAHENTLKEHSQIHEPYPYICFCGIGYYLEIDFKKHSNLVHKETVTIVETTKAKTPESKVIYKDDFEDDVFDDKASDKSDCNDDEYGKKARNTSKNKRPKIRIKIRDETKDESNEVVDCSYCGETIRSNDLTRHMKVRHSIRSYNCTMCERGFKNKKRLDMHMLAHEACKYCGKQFNNKSAKSLHERTHTGERPFSCKFCSKPFSDPSALARHHRTHTKEFKYFCDMCPKKFTDKSGLIGHRVRHEKRQFECDICNRLFYTKYDLKKHTQTHIGEKNFECNDCGKKFILKSYLFVHITNSCEVRRKTCPKNLKNKKGKKKAIKIKVKIKSRKSL